MRKFFIYYKVYSGCGEYNYYSGEIYLKPNEKANLETFNKILSGFSGGDKEILSWSLIEE